MQEFETFVYLDVQKTGSTFIAKLLRRFCSEKEVLIKRHKAAGRRYDRGKFYFISIRNPKDQYVSLYSHGCDGSGALYNRLRKLGHGDLYDDSTWRGFRRWLKFVVQPDNAALLDRAYGRAGGGSIGQMIGFQSYRFLELAMLKPVKTLLSCKTRDDVLKAYDSGKIARFTVRNESLTADMEQLLTTHLRNSITDLDGALRHLREGRHLNVSNRIDRYEDNPDLGPNIRRLLVEREWFLHELFDY
jgi:hypothetical protein